MKTAPLALLLAGFLSAQTLPPVHVGAVYPLKRPLLAKPTVDMVLEFAPMARGAKANLASLQSNLQLVEDGALTSKPKQVTTFRELQPSQGLALVVAIDLSGGVSSYLEGVKRGLLQHLQDKRPIDRLAVVTFADNVRIVANFAAEPEKVRQAIQHLHPESSRATQLYRGIYKAVQLFDDADPLPARCRVLVISDGMDGGLNALKPGEVISADDIVELARKHGVAVDSIGVPSRANPRREIEKRVKQDWAKQGLSGQDLANQDWKAVKLPALPPVPSLSQVIDAAIDPKAFLETLERISNKTDGYFVPSNSGAEVAADMQAGIAWLANTPVARFDLANIDLDGQTHQLGVHLLAKNANVERAWLTPYDPNPLRRYKAWLGAIAVAAVALFLLLRPRPAAPPMATMERERPAPMPVLLPIDRPRVPTAAPPVAASRPQQRARAATQVISVGAACLLRVTAGPHQGAALPLEADLVTVGYEPDNDLCLGQDCFVSGHHARLLFRDGALLVADLGSTNGTWVNGSKIAPQAQRGIAVGDRLQFGQSVVEISA